MGTWYTNDAEFFAATSSLTATLFDDFSEGFYSPPLSLFNGTVLALSGIDYEVILAGGSEKTLRNATGIVLRFTGYNAFGAYINFTDISNGKQQDEVYIQVTGLDDYFVYAPEDAAEFFIGYINNDLIYNPVEVSFDTNTYESTNSVGIEELYFNIVPREITETQVLTVENLILDNVYAQAFIDVPSIQSAESFKKPLIFPTPYPGRIYFWYEQIHSIEFELNVRSQQ